MEWVRVGIIFLKRNILNNYFYHNTYIYSDLLRSKLEIEEFSGSFFHVFKKADVNGDSVLQKEEFIGIFKWNLDVRTE